MSNVESSICCDDDDVSIGCVAVEPRVLVGQRDPQSSSSLSKFIGISAASFGMEVASHPSPVG